MDNEASAQELWMQASPLGLVKGNRAHPSRSCQLSLFPE